MRVCYICDRHPQRNDLETIPVCNRCAKVYDLDDAMQISLDVEPQARPTPKMSHWDDSIPT